MRDCGLLYDTVDGSDSICACPAEKAYRTKMNMTFTIGNDDEMLEKKFLAEAQKVQLT